MWMPMGDNSNAAQQSKITRKNCSVDGQGNRKRVRPTATQPARGRKPIATGNVTRQLTIQNFPNISLLADWPER
jgi:hypothetical protein